MSPGMEAGAGLVSTTEHSEVGMFEKLDADMRTVEVEGMYYASCSRYCLITN